MSKKKIDHKQFLANMREFIGLNESDYIINPYQPIRYGMKIELYVDRNEWFETVFKLNRIAKVIAYNIMIDVLRERFKEKLTRIPTHYYMKIYNEMIEDLSDDNSSSRYYRLFRFLRDSRVLHDVILFGLINAQTIYNEMGYYCRKSTFKDNDSIMFSTLSLGQYTSNHIDIKCFGKVNTMTILDKRRYKSKNVVKIVKDCDQYYMLLGKRYNENSKTHHMDEIKTCVDPKTGMVCEIHSVYEC